MATSVGFGFDTSFLKNLELADKKMADLMDKNNALARSTIQAFQQMSQQGVVPYVQSLESQKNVLGQIKESITTTSGRAKRDFGEMKRSVVYTTNTLVSLINTLKNNDSYLNESRKASNTAYYNHWMEMMTATVKKNSTIVCQLIY